MADSPSSDSPPAGVTLTLPTDTSTSDTQTPSPAKSPTASAADDQLVAGQQVGRYRVERLLGRGGMGSVYAAHDTRLDRVVALKVLRQRGPTTKAEEREQLLLREARALAKLSHPNVVAVFDSGRADGRVFIAMEYVEGNNLKEWNTGERTFEDIADVFSQAGAGLHAAHTAGIVHRDFKPANVLVRADGRVQVADFGLARLPHQPDARDTTEIRGDGSGSITQSVAGTPAYMAPEQHRSGDVDHRCDQFAWCVALYEAVAGHRPFAAGDASTLRDNIVAGNMLPMGDAPRPRWLAPLLARGLAADPARRFESMQPLLAELSRARGRWKLVAGAAGMAVAGLAAGVLLLGSASTSATCTGARAKLAGIWDAPRRAQIERAFGNTGKPYAAATFARVATVLDHYTEDWQSMHTASCRATHVTKEQSPAILAVEMRCLDRRLGRVRALVDNLSKDVDAGPLDNAVDAAHKLPDLARCADTEALTETIPPPSGEAAVAAERVQAMLDEAATLDELGQSQPAYELATRAAADAAAIGYAPLYGEALTRRGVLEFRLDKLDAMEATLREAALAAADGKDDETAATAWVFLVRGMTDRRLADADSLLTTAHAAVARAGSPPHVKAQLLFAEMDLREEQARFDDAGALGEQGLAIELEQHPGDPDHPHVLAMRSALANIARVRGDYPGALAVMTEVLRGQEAAYGARHPKVADSLYNMTLLMKDEDGAKQTLPLLMRALSIYEEALGPQHQKVAGVHAAIAMALGKLADDETALPHYDAALAIYTGSLGDTAPERGDVLVGTAGALKRLGRSDDAMRAYDEALAVYAQSAANHPRRAIALVNSANLLVDLGRRLDEAESRYETAARIIEAALGPNHPLLRNMTIGIARCRVDSHRASTALEPARRTLALAPDAADMVAGQAHVYAGIALWERGKRRDGRAEVERGRDLLSTAGDDAKHEHDRATAWLAAH